ncbi:MAG: hypothetical protein LKI94_08105 [Sporolactobacillus sp.]|nr:hypothetical protein [Sporolactobacillus sp.]MCI1882138.1 hypothetical protein [Sporolactobacillus sp.]
MRGDIVDMIYRDRTGAFTRRRIRILNDGGDYIRAYCYTRRQVRTFSRLRILAMVRVYAAGGAEKVQ